MSHPRPRTCRRKATRPLPSMGCADRDAPRKALSKPAAFVVLCKGLTLKTELTAERLRELLHYNPETGVFTWLVHRFRHKAGSVAGSPESDGHTCIGVCGRNYRAHRLAWLYVHGHWPKQEIDHINGVRTDNRIANLRDVSRTVNSENLRSAKSNNTSGFLGIYLHKKSGLWHASIKVNGRKLSLKYHKTKEEAYAVYVEAKRRLHIGCVI